MCTRMQVSTMVNSIENKQKFSFQKHVFYSVLFVFQINNSFRCEYIETNTQDNLALYKCCMFMHGLI